MSRHEAAGTVLRGGKFRIFPSAEQRAAMDGWRRGTVRLWNLLLELEQAAYSGEHVRPELRWREIWASVLEENYESDRERWEHGWKRRDGSYRKLPGPERPPRADGSREQPPEPPDEVLLAKIRRQHWERETDIDPETGEVLAERDKLTAGLFIWERELQALMARLKHVPQTGWIAGLPSHAAQAVIKDLLRALNTMLAERRKRQAGKAARDTGFPKFKTSRGAAGSVYLANTQVKFDHDSRKLMLPNGVGWIGWDRHDGIRPEYAAGKFMGGRIWRQGEKWYFSGQWRIQAPKPAPKTGRTAGVKLAASVAYTTMDGEGRSRQYEIRGKYCAECGKEDCGEHHAGPSGPHKRRLKRASRTLSRRIEAHRERERKAVARKQRQGKLRGKPRVKRSKGFFEAAERIAALNAAIGNFRNDRLHKYSRAIADSFDEVALHDQDVAAMMRRPPPDKRRRRHEREAEAGAKQRAPKDIKALRVANRAAAMGRARFFVEYKQRDGGGKVHLLSGLMPVVQQCAACGALHPKMRDGKPALRCDCGHALDRRKNAAINLLWGGLADLEAEKRLSEDGGDAERAPGA